MLSCLAGPHLNFLPFIHCFSAQEEGDARPGIWGRVYPMPRPSAKPPVDEDEEYQDLRALGNPYVYAEPACHASKGGCCQYHKGHPTNDPGFKDLLRQLEEEHEKIVEGAQEFLMGENAKLREENEQLRMSLRMERERVNDGPNEGGDFRLMRCDSQVAKKASAYVRSQSSRLLRISPQEDCQQIGDVYNAFSVVANPSDHFRDHHQDSVIIEEVGNSSGSRLKSRRASTADMRALSPPSGGKKSNVGILAGTNWEIMGRTDLARILGPSVPERNVISPVSRFRLTWDFVAFSALLSDLWTTPIELVFMSETIIPQGFSMMSWAVTSFFILDILLNFNTGYIERDKLILQRVPSIKKYLKGWFWVDVFATLPLDIIITAFLNRFDGEVLSMAHVARLTKVTKVLKTLRFLKMLRAIRLVQQMGRADEFLEVYQLVKYAVRLFQLLTSFAFMAHLHGCVYAMLQPGMTNQDDLDRALHYYYLSFRWAYNAITVGDMTHSTDKSPAVWTLEMFVASERILIAMIVGSWGIAKALTLFQEDAQLTLVKNAAVGFFRQHAVSIETQISVMYSLHETRAAQKMQRHFKSLMSEHLPDELRRTVSEELWVPHLMTLGLINHIATWHEDFVVELALLVREEVVASKTVLCKEGHASIAAYHILKGRLVVASSHNHGLMPDFTDGMWVEEHSLVSPIRRRTSTIVTPLLTRLMAVPTQQFHELIATLGLDNKMQEFRDTTLARGLCGRCGDVGDHFTHACPRANPHTHKRKTTNRQEHRRKLSWPYRFLRGRHLRSSVLRTWQSEAEGSWSLTAFLHAHRLSSLAPVLKGQNVESQADLEDLDYDALGEQVDDDLRRQLSFLHALVLEQQEQVAFQVCDELASAQHLAFLSHYKMESGTEAALMRAEIERVLMEDRDSAAHGFNVPIFLDSEDLSDLEELQEHVRNSHNLVLLLTKDVLLRPWVLVEIVTAIETDVRVLPVEVNRKGVGFVFPDEEFYNKLLAGKVLDVDGQALLRERGIELRDVERALREVFNKIALPYSPHRSESIRMAEVKAIYKQLLYRRCSRAEHRISMAPGR